MAASPGGSVVSFRLFCGLVQLSLNDLGYRDYWDKEMVKRFRRDMDAELRSAYPPSLPQIVGLYLMLDTKFMVALLSQQLPLPPRNNAHLSIASISQDSSHSLHSNVKFAFEWAQNRRTSAGFPPDPWPMVFDLPIRRDRRLTWEPTIREIKEAWKMYHRFVREGFRPFSVNSEGDPLVLVTSFDPRAGEIMFRAGD